MRALIFCSPVIIALSFCVIFITYPKCNTTKPALKQDTVTYNIQKDSIVNDLLFNQKPVSTKFVKDNTCKTLIIEYPNKYKFQISYSACIEFPEGCWNYFLVYKNQIIPIESNCAVVGNMVSNETYKILRTRFNNLTR